MGEEGFLQRRVRLRKLLKVAVWVPFLLGFAWGGQGFLRGVVIDARTGLPVAGAQLSVQITLQSDSAEGTRLLTDSAGRFSATMPAGTVELWVQADGYEATRLFEVPVRSGASPEVRVLLQEMGVRAMGSTTVQASPSLGVDPRHSTSVTRLTRDQVENSPGSSQDVNRVLTSLPAVSGTADDNWNTFVVRGGTSSENMFLLDGIEVANLSHWGDEYTNGGAIGMLRLDFVRDLDFYAGGMPAAMPSRLGSVTDIRLREGDMRSRHWQADLNMAGAGVFAEGPVVVDNMSYMAGARVSFLELLSKMMPYNGVPEYRNAQGKLFWKMGRLGELSWNVLAGDESIAMDNGREGKTASDGGHAITGLAWDMRHPNWNHQFHASGFYSDFSAHQTTDSIDLFQFRSEVKKYQLKEQLQFFIREADIVTLGVVADLTDRSEEYREPLYYLALRGDTMAYMEDLLIGYPDSLYRDTLGGDYARADTSGRHWATHASWLIDLGQSQIGAEARHDYYELLDAHGFSPRLSYTYKLGRQSSASLSGGLYHQFPEDLRLMELLDNDSGYTLKEIPLQRAWSVALGYKRALGESLLLDAETWYKWYDREACYALDSLQGDRSVTPVGTDFGHRRAAGLEMHLRKPRQDRFFYELAYSFTIAEQEYADGTWVPADENRRHNGKLILGSRLTQSHSVSGRIDLSEGRPYTPVDEERSLATWRTVYDIDEGWNSKRREFVANLALRYTHKSNYDWGRVESYCEVTNLLNRVYPVQEYYERGRTPADGRIASFDSRGIFFVGGVSVNY